MTLIKQQFSGTGLGCERGGRELFRDRSFLLQPGELLSIAGPNGAGKTSLLRILAGLAPADAGEVRWGEQLIAKSLSFRQQMAYVGHRPGTKAHETPLQHCRNRLALAGVVVEQAAMHAALAEVGLADFFDWPCGELSVGQNRRAALACLRLRAAPLWIVDEPLAGLDVEGQALMARLLSEHAATGGMAVLTTHQPLDLAGLTQHVLQVGQ